VIWEDNIKMSLKEMGCEDDWIELAQDIGSSGRFLWISVRSGNLLMTV